MLRAAGAAGKTRPLPGRRGERGGGRARTPPGAGGPTPRGRPPPRRGRAPPPAPSARRASPARPSLRGREAGERRGLAHRPAPSPATPGLLRPRCVLPRLSRRAPRRAGERWRGWPGRAGTEAGVGTGRRRRGAAGLVCSRGCERSSWAPAGAAQTRPGGGGPRASEEERRLPAEAGPGGGAAGACCCLGLGAKAFGEGEGPPPPCVQRFFPLLLRSSGHWSGARGYEDGEVTGCERGHSQAMQNGTCWFGAWGALGMLGQADAGS